MGAMASDRGRNPVMAECEGRRARGPKGWPGGWTFVVGALLWLPATFLLFGLLRGYTLEFDAMMAIDIIVFMGLGVPLAVTCRSIHAMGHGVLAWALFGPLAFLTFLFVLPAGLLGPVAIVLATLVGCLPALGVWGGLRGRRWFRARQSVRQDGEQLDG